MLTKQQYKKAKSLLFKVDPQERDDFEDNDFFLTGKNGQDGTQGERGEKGDTGERGEQGLPGFRGERGERGDKGDQGEPGKNGNSVDLKEVIEEIQPEIMRRIPQGGGNMNRNIWINGNSSVLNRYTDINLKSGTNVTIQYSNNDSLRTTDITLIASGGGGGGGLSRSINTINTSQTIGAASATDYVYLCSAGIQVTLPDATAGNTNLYTIKNTSTSSVLVNTTSAQTIDGQTTVVMPTQYTSIDLESDSLNWNIT